MVVSTITIIALPENFDAASLRPQAYVAWTGGTGPFDVLHEWDDNTSFTSPLQDNNIGVTSPNTGIPPSDMGGIGTDWYYRATVTDSLAALQEPLGSYRTIHFLDPDSFIRYLYVNHNVGVGFGVDDFDSLDLADGNPNEFSRYLYLNSNVDASQPCPWLDTISPTLQVQGGTVTLTGDSFGALQSTYTTEIRLYDAQGDHGGSYVEMTASSWSDTEVSVTVPSGATTGWVSVVQTGGTPTCSGSAFFLLNVELVAANPDMGWWIIAVDKENQVI